MTENSAQKDPNTPTPLPKGRSKKKRIIVVLGISLLLLLGLFLFWEHTNGKKAYLTLYGNVDVRQVDLGFRVYGRVEQLMFEEGDKVQHGQLMACIEKKPYSDDVIAKKAALISAKATLVNTQSILKRRCELISSGSVSQEDLDDALTSFEVAAETVKQATAELAIAEKNLKDTEMFAPTQGTLLTRIREPGSIVTPNDAVYTLSISTPVWIRVFAHEPELGLIAYGMPAEIFTDTPGGKVYTGNVGFISPVSEFTPKTVESTQLRTDLVYRLRVYADNPDDGLKQGMPVTVRLYPSKKGPSEKEGASNGR